jgi:hypothetical protein
MSSEEKKNANETKFSLSKQPKYYEMDGALRAYANRNFVLAVLGLVIAVGAGVGYLFLRFQPPTVIRVLPSGEASVVGADGTMKTTTSPAILKNISNAQAPSEYEKEAYVRTFLENYLNYDEHTIANNWSHALNMMTGNLRSAALAKFQKDDTVGKYELEHVRSVFKLTSLVPDQNDPMQYTSYGVRRVHRMGASQTEFVDEVVETYQVRLSESDRSVLNPSGLLIAQVNSNQIHAESKTVDSTMNSDSEGGGN